MSAKSESEAEEDSPQLSEYAQAVLQEFYQERAAREQQGAGPVYVQENWVCDVTSSASLVIYASIISMVCVRVFHNYNISPFMSFTMYSCSYKLWELTHVGSGAMNGCSYMCNNYYYYSLHAEDIVIECECILRCILR